MPSNYFNYTNNSQPFLNIIVGDLLTIDAKPSIYEVCSVTVVDNDTFELVIELDGIRYFLRRKSWQINNLTRHRR
jgi:hypothetical protein